MKLISLTRTHSRAENIALIFAFSVLMGLLARVAVPLPFTPVPVTGQTLGVLLAGLLLGGPRAAAAMALYLAEGAAGLPVFSPAGPGGLAQLAGPTGGFLLSYPLAALVAGSGLRPVLLALLSGEAVIFLCGAAWLAAFVPAATVWRAGVLPFLPGEVVKIALVLALAPWLRGNQAGGGAPR